MGGQVERERDQESKLLINFGDHWRELHGLQPLKLTTHPVGRQWVNSLFIQIQSQVNTAQPNVSSQCVYLLAQMLG